MTETKTFEEESLLEAMERITDCKERDLIPIENVVKKLAQQMWADQELLRIYVKRTENLELSMKFLAERMNDLYAKKFVQEHTK